MFDKLMAAQGKAEEIKKRLDTISVFGEVEGGAIKVTATANKAITAIAISDEFYEQADKEELEELLQAGRARCISLWPLMYASYST